LERKGNWIGIRQRRVGSSWLDATAKVEHGVDVQATGVESESCSSGGGVGRRVPTSGVALRLTLEQKLVAVYASECYTFSFLFVFFRVCLCLFNE
jgi:hypothetical protein